MLLLRVFLCALLRLSLRDSKDRLVHCANLGVLPVNILISVMVSIHTSQILLISMSIPVTNFVMGLREVGITMLVVNMLLALSLLGLLASHLHRFVFRSKSLLSLHPVYMVLVVLNNFLVNQRLILNSEVPGLLSENGYLVVWQVIGVLQVVLSEFVRVLDMGNGVLKWVVIVIHLGVLWAGFRGVVVNGVSFVGSCCDCGLILNCLVLRAIFERSIQVLVQLIK